MATQYAFGKIVTDGLVLALDAADKNSYPGSGTTWRDMSGNNITGSLINSPTFNTSNGGNFGFVADDYIVMEETKKPVSKRRLPDGSYNKKPLDPNYFNN